jgi:hypothetical protein
VNHFYGIYGLTLSSDVVLPGLCDLPTVVARADLCLQLAETPRWAEQALGLPARAVRRRPNGVLDGDPAFTVTETKVPLYHVLRYGDGTRFVLDSCCTKLWGEPGPGLSHEDLCVYLFGPVMGFLLRKKGLTPLHASAVSIQDRAAALVGESGAGKSTTAAALALRGWPVLCEDVCAFDEQEGRFLLRPAYPRVLLWPDSVKFFYSSEQALPLVVPGWDKRFLPLNGSGACFADTPSALTAIFFLAPRSSDDAAPRIEKLSPQQAVPHLVQDTYMNWLLDSAQRAAEFDVLTRLVQKVECYRVTPSSDPARLPQLAQLIEARVLRAAVPPSYSAVGTGRDV